MDPPFEEIVPSTARTRISIDDKLKIIKLLETKAMTRIEVASMYNMSKSTISKIMKNKKLYVGKPDLIGRIRMRKLKYYELEAPLFSYIEGLKKLGQNVTGNMIKAEATRLGLDFGLVDFKASNGWLYKFQRRYKALHSAEDESVMVQNNSTVVELSDDDEDDDDYDEDNNIEMMTTTTNTYEELPCDPLFEPSVELTTETKPTQDEIDAALNTLKWAIETQADEVPYKIWESFDEVREFLMR